VNELRIGCIVLCFFSTLAVARTLLGSPRTEPPTLGYRGTERLRARREHALFRAVEPVLLFGAWIIALLSLDELRSRQAALLERSDHCLGLTPDELSALCVVSGSAGAGLGLLVDMSRNGAPLFWALGLVLGLFVPTARIREIGAERARRITRLLPPGIEIVALCMGAGADFPGAIRLVARTNPDERDPLRREFTVLLDALELGQTRKEALLGMRRRVPCPAVDDFCTAVIQADERGNPLAQVIQTQGRTLNQKRSVLAEEAAARAGVLMMAPMMLLLASILLLLLGPFVITGLHR
jgi:tight adherence protein C